MEFRVLGPLEVLADGREVTISSPQQRALLALLLVNANRVLSPDRIVDDVWEGRPPATGTKALAFHVSRLRDALVPGRLGGEPAGGLETAAGGYVLRVDPGAIDAVRFERLARDAHERLASEPAAARSLLLEALGLWRGDALIDVAYAEFAQAEIRRLEELRMCALEDRLEADLALGGHAAAIGEIEALLEANPMRERLRGMLMLALYRSGRQAEALRIAGAGRRLLSEELGIDPSPDLVQLEAQILAQDPALELTRPTTAVRAERARNPYKGLRAFGEADSADFFGHEALVGRLVSRVDEVAHAGRLLAVVGPSGSGKSSVVRAGLLPALRAGAAGDGGPWRIATMVPGVAPFRELAAALAAGGHQVSGATVDRAEESGDIVAVVGEALAADGGRLLLVIDQLEELFVRVDEQARSLFLGGLVAALKTPGSPLVILATLRADFLHVPLALADVGELVREGTELVTPLSRAELERAIVRPADAVGVEVEPALVVEIVNDVERRPGMLPLLQFALTELFDRSDGRRLTRAGYEAIGGSLGALGRRADEAWRSLDPDGREIAQQVFLDLIALADSGVATSRRVPRAELESLAGDHGTVAVVLDDLGRRGLLTFDLDRVAGAPTVEIAHEALLAHWSRLAGWIEDMREDLWTRRRLVDAAEEWQAAGRSPGFLSAGPKLERFESWARTSRLRPTEEEQAYLDASTAERARLADVEAERAGRERHLERRSRVLRRGMVGVLAGGIVLSGGLSAVVFGERQAAVEQADVARARELAGLAVAKLGEDRPLSVLLALEAADATAGRGYVVEEAYDALQWTLQEGASAFPRGDLPVGVRLAPDGPRGVFLVAPEALMRLGIAYVDRYERGSPSLEECRIYLHAEACPLVTPPGDGVSLGVRTAAGVVTAASLAFGPLSGTHVRVLSELPADITALTAQFQQETGIAVEGDALPSGGLAARIATGDLPDVAIVSRPSLVAAAARDGLLLDIGSIVDTASLRADVGGYAMDLGAVRMAGSAGGVVGQFGLPLAASVDDLLWYPKDAFAAAGYTPPTTPADLDALLARMRADGRVPWCLGAETGSGLSAASSWVEGLLLDERGPASYDGWVTGDISFASPAVGAAFDAFGGYVARPGAVFNGLDAAARTSDRIAGLPMVLPGGPGCWLFRGSSTDRTDFGSRASALGSVPFPGGSAASPPVLGRTYVAVVLRDRPEVRRFVQMLVGAPFAAAIAAGLCGEGIFPVRDLAAPGDCPAAPDARRLHDGLRAGTFRVRALDLLPEKVASGFLDDVAGYLWTASRVGAPPNLYEWGDWSADMAWRDVRAEAAP